MSVGVWRKQVFNSRKEENFPSAGVVQKRMAVVVRPVKGYCSRREQYRSLPNHTGNPLTIESDIEVPQDLLNHSQHVLGSLSPRIPGSVSHTPTRMPSSLSPTHAQFSFAVWFVPCLPFFLLPCFLHFCIYSHEYFRTTFMKSRSGWSRFLNSSSFHF